MGKINLYVASVEMANRIASNTGDLNVYDHVARDLHEEEFDEIFEKLDYKTRNFILNEFYDEIFNLSKKYRK